MSVIAANSGQDHNNVIESNYFSPNKPHHKPRFSICLLFIISLSFVLLQIFSFQDPASDGSVQELEYSMAEKLREAVTFLPLKDLRYANNPTEGHTWFMSSMNDTHEQGEARYQRFPSKASKGRVLCLKGHDTRDGSWNYYALAWPKTLPRNAVPMGGTTFVSYNHYDYDNIWHGLTTLMPFVSWHIKSQCVAPKRWILYHWGEIRIDLALWVKTLMEATFGVPIRLENFDGINGTNGYDDPPACFEEAVVMRRNEGGMLRSRVIEVYDLIRCKSRMYCNVSSRNDKDYYSSIGMTLLMRDGARSFNNPTKVVDIFEKSCMKVKGCRLMVVYPHNLTVCEQVKLMSLTDILVSPHGAQLTNMILMDRNSSVMEFFPKGWLELAGVGQYVYHWLARWSGMRHEGAWRDPVSSEPCQFHENNPKCMPMVKIRKIGLNETYFSEWAERVLSEVKLRKSQEGGGGGTRKSPVSGVCGCL